MHVRMHTITTAGGGAPPGNAPTVVGAAVVTLVSSNTTIDAAMPTVVPAGNLLVASAWAGVSTAGGFGTPTGWTLIGHYSNNGLNLTGATASSMFYKVADGTEGGTNVSLTHAGSAGPGGVAVIQINGANTTNPLDDTLVINAGGGSDIATLASPTLTTADTNRLILRVIIIDGNPGAVTTPSTGSPDLITPRWSAIPATPDGHCAGATEVAAAAGAVGTRTWTWVTARRAAAGTLAIKP